MNKIVCCKYWKNEFCIVFANDVKDMNVDELKYMMVFGDTYRNCPSSSTACSGTFCWL